MFKIVVDHIKNKDESFSYEGTKDFIQPEGDVKSLGPKVSVSRPPQTQRSKNNSY